jgi:hypothetical protein
VGAYNNSKRGVVVLDAVRGTIPNGLARAGKQIEMRLTATPDEKTMWVSVRIADERSRSYQYSGRNLKAARAQLDELRSALATAGTLEAK